MSLLCKDLTVQFQIERQHQRPLYLQVVEQIQARIRSGALPLGTRLPPIRQLAQELGLTRLTVHNAYAELQADGWIESFVGRGTYVAGQPARGVPFNGAPVSTVIEDACVQAAAAAIDAATVRVGLPAGQAGRLGEMMQLSQRPDVISFAQASAARDTFPTREFNRAVQHVLAHDGPQVWDYGLTQGEAVLRDQLANWLLDRAVEVAPEQIVVVNGAQQGIDIALRALTAAGDTVLVEQPTYLGMIERMQAQGLRLVGVPMDGDGIQPDAFEQAVIVHRPKLVYLVPTYHNPTGISLSDERREAVLRIAAHYRVPILEDDIYGALSYDNPAPLPLKARDTDGLVVYLTSFSKVLMPGLRIGLLAAAPPLLEPLIAAKRLADLHSPQITQRAVAEYLAHGHWNAHLRMVRATYRERRDAMTAHLRSAFPRDVAWTAPAGGFCIWLRLPPSLHALDLYVEAIERGVAFVPGQAFFPEQVGHEYLRLSFAAHAPSVIAQGMAILGDLMHEQLARRSRFRMAVPGATIPMV